MKDRARVETQSSASGGDTQLWLRENGPRELESLFGTIVSHVNLPILIADSERKYHGASAGAGKLLGLPREKLIGRSIDDVAEPSFRPKLAQMWQTFLKKGEQEGALRLLGRDGTPREVEYTVTGNLLPARHLVVLRDKASRDNGVEISAGKKAELPSWVRDYALYLLDAEGCFASWYSGAARIYGYAEDEVLGKSTALLHPAEGGADANAAQSGRQEELRRAAAEGHFGNECWHVRKDGSRFWANTITMALKSADGELRGFAAVARDFSDRHERDEELRRSRERMRPKPLEPRIAGIVSGEYDRIPEANDAFLELTGYSRGDLTSGRLYWPALTPPEYFDVDELAYEEGLRFGACTPYEKELIRKDGTHARVLVVTAVLKLLPFRWLTMMQDLSERDRVEEIGEFEAGTQSIEFAEIVGTSAPLKRVLSQIEVVAPTDANVLILGETGTGKELVARAIHRLSPRRDRPFITLNCAAIPTGLLESELFGYERGAFTGALSQKLGRFELAHKGTLFLDEVGDIPLDLQPKLLRALQEKSFERLGGIRTIPIDVRLVAATNRNLAQMMGDKLFRSDLYYRLKVFPITTPPLRDHPEDIPILARHFTRIYAARMNRQIDKIPAETMRALMNWPWPGNVRELENFIERSVILSSGPQLRAPLAELREEGAGSAGGTLEQVERDYILRVFRETEGVISLAATRLGIPRTTLNAMMKKLGISRNDL